MQKEDNNGQAGTGDNSEQKAEDNSVSQHSIKPNVSGLPSLSPNTSSLSQYTWSDGERVNLVRSVSEIWIQPAASFLHNGQEVKVYKGVANEEGAAILRDMKLGRHKGL